MKRFLAAIVLVLALSFTAWAVNSVTLSWDQNCSTQVVGYNLHYGNIGTNITTNIVAAYVNDCGISVPAATNVYAGNYTNLLAVAGRTNSLATVGSLTPGKTYYFSVASVDTNGLESQLTQEIAYTVPATTNGLPSAVQNFHVLSIK